ncbi:unnamed protein product, partial [Staurois parvus]
MPHHWCQWEEQCPIIGVSGRKSAPSLVSVTPMRGHYSSHTDTNDGALLLPLTLI